MAAKPVPQPSKLVLPRLRRVGGGTPPASGPLAHLEWSCPLPL